MVRTSAAEEICENPGCAAPAVLAYAFDPRPVYCGPACRREHVRAKRRIHGFRPRRALAFA